jgi:beta-mannanase
VEGVTNVQNIKFGISTEDYAAKNGQINYLETRLGIAFSTVSIFKQFGLDSNKYFDAASVANIGLDKKLLIAWEPWNPQEGLNQSTDYLGQIPAGAFDEYLTAFAKQVKSYQKPVIIRFAHEMNGNWYPWGNRPGEYVKAYRYIVTVFKKTGVKNVSFMWSINANSVPAEPISAVSKYYPGNDVVDEIGIDGFNWGGIEWRSFSSIFDAPYKYLTVKYTKPIKVSETASSEIGGNKSAWVNQMFKDLFVKYPKFQEVIWFNMLKENDWRINSTDSSLKAFKDNF